MIAWLCVWKITVEQERWLVRPRNACPNVTVFLTVNIPSARASLDRISIEQLIGYVFSNVLHLP
jgi:hypothetical protein